QVGAGQVVPVGEVVGQTQPLQVFLQLGVLERLLLRGGQPETHGARSPQMRMGDPNHLTCRIFTILSTGTRRGQSAAPIAPGWARVQAAFSSESSCSEAATSRRSRANISAVARVTVGPGPEGVFSSSSSSLVVSLPAAIPRATAARTSSVCVGSAGGGVKETEGGVLGATGAATP